MNANMVPVSARLSETFKKSARDPFLIDAAENKVFTYAESLSQARRLAAFMAEVGIAPGVPIAFSMDNCRELGILYLAAMLRGSPMLPINPGLSTQDFNTILSGLGVEHIFISPGTYSRHKSGLDSLPGLNAHCMSPASQPLKAASRDLITFDFDNIISTYPESAGDFSAGDQATLMLMPTSGTSGTPKVLDIAWGALFGNAAMFTETMGIDASSRFYNILPMTYLGGSYNLFAIPMSRGASVVIDAPFGGAVMYGFWDAVREYGINTLWFTSTMLSMLLEIDDGEDLSFLAGKIRLGLVGMAPLSPDVKKRFEERFGFRLYENFALSETLFLTSQRVGGPWIPGSSGPVLPGVTVNIADARSGAALGPECEGEIKIATPFRIKGYRLAGDADRSKLLPDGGMLTGDLGKFNAEGELLVTGRLKDLIIRGGVNISPKFVEDVLLGCDCISEAAVVGLPDPFYNEEVAAAVQLKTEFIGKITEKTLLAFCQERLPAFQCPKRVFFMESLPKGVTGKIQKSVIKEKLLEIIG